MTLAACAAMPCSLPRILAIGGSDSCGGAGIQVDVKTGMALGVEVSTAITAVTAQNTLGVQKIAAISLAMLTAQIDSVCQDTPPAVMKLGMLVDAARVQVVVDAIRKYAPAGVVCDPILASTSGRTLLDENGRRTLIRLFPFMTLLTPNAQEAAILSGRRAETQTELFDAVHALQDQGASSVLLKGGHTGGNESADALFLLNQTSPLWFSAPRIETRNDHGTGCVLATAIAAFLARGSTLVEAVGCARKFVQQALARSASYHNGNGRGGMLLVPVSNGSHSGFAGGYQ